MSEPTTGACARSDHDRYCGRCDRPVGLEGLHVTAVGLEVTVETPARKMGCRGCGSVVHSHGRHAVGLVDTPCFGRPVDAGVAQAQLAVRGGGLPDEHLHRGRPRHRPAEGAADHAGVLVGDPSDPS